MVDCAGGDWENEGCGGGLPAFAFLYTDKYPLMLEADYEYAGVEQACQYDEKKQVAGASSQTFSFVPVNDPYQLQAAVQLGPVAVSIDASSLAFQLYNGNHIISNEHENCGDELNHAVTVVGYNAEDPEKPYWIVRNSWGPDWGDQGYAKIMIVPGEGVCGIQTEPTYPNVYYVHKNG